MSRNAVGEELGGKYDLESRGSAFSYTHQQEECSSSIKKCGIMLVL